MYTPDNEDALKSNEDNYISGTKWISIIEPDVYS